MEVEKTRVLVVDDESVLAGVVANYLDRAGFATRLSGDGLEAVELVDEWAPAVVLLDLGLPGARRDRGVSANPSVQRLLHHHADRT